MHLAGQLLKNPLFQLGGVLVSAIYIGTSFLSGEIKGLGKEIKGLGKEINDSGTRLEAKIETGRTEEAREYREMQATLNAILEDLGSLKAQRRWW